MNLVEPGAPADASPSLPNRSEFPPLRGIPFEVPTRAGSMSRHHGIPSQPHGDQHLKDVDPAWVVRASIGMGKSIRHNIMIIRSNTLIALPLNRGVHSGKPWMAAVLAVATL